MMCTWLVDIDLHPPVEAAGIHLGMTRSEARRRCAALGEPAEFRRSREANPSLIVERASGLSIFVYFDDGNAVEAVEFGRPCDDEDIVRYRGLDIFSTPAGELVKRLQNQGRIDIAEQGCSVTAPDLLLALWRPVVPEGPDDDDGRFFESVLVAHPNYYS